MPPLVETPVNEFVKFDERLLAGGCAERGSNEAHPRPRTAGLSGTTRGRGHEPPLLAGGEPPPWEIVNPSGRAAVLFTCDHASHAVPAALNGLGLDPADLGRHIGWDPGGAELTRRLSQRFDAPAVLSAYSRLVIDCNRMPGHPESILPESDGTPVPGNRGLTQQEADRRAGALFHPYHEAIAGILDRFRSRGETPAYVAIHTFAPSLDGRRRPWHFGVLWDRDGRLARPLIEALKRLGELIVGDNEPYSGREQYAFSNRFHATSAGLPNAMVEVRQDLLADEAGLARCTRILAGALEEVLDRCGTREEVG